MHTAMLPLPVDYIQAYKPSLRPIQLRCVIINQCVTSMKNFLRRVNYLSNGDVDLYKTLIGRAHSFVPRAAEFRADPRIWVFPAEFLPRNSPRNSSFCRGNPAGFDVFHSNSYFFTENDLKVALLQVCL